MASEQLSHAAELLREGQFDQARVIIAKFLQQNPKSDDGWVLLSFAIADSGKKLECVERALQINPENQQAQKRMAELKALPSQPAAVEEPVEPEMTSEELHSRIQTPPLEEPIDSPLPSDSSQPDQDAVRLSEVDWGRTGASSLSGTNDSDESDAGAVPLSEADWARTEAPVSPETGDLEELDQGAVPLRDEDWARTETAAPQEAGEKEAAEVDQVPLTAEDWARTGMPDPQQSGELDQAEEQIPPISAEDWARASASSIAESGEPEAIEGIEEPPQIGERTESIEASSDLESESSQAETPRKAGPLKAKPTDTKPSDRWGVMVAAQHRQESEEAPAPALDSKAMAELREQSSQRRLGLAIPLVLIGIVMMIAICAGGFFFGYPLYQEFRASMESTRSVERAQVAAVVATQGGNVELPPTWTPTITPTITNTPTPRPTNTATATATIVLPNPTEMAEMEAIMTEVSDLRGLAVVDTTDSYLLSKPKVRPILENMFLVNGGTLEEVEDQKRGLVVLGLVKPTYNLYDNILNNIADGLGGFYDPQSKQLFVIGHRFGGIEHYIFSHEFDHALVDQHFQLDKMGVYPLCVTNEDNCRAIRALVEGDATLLMDQWWEQYASPQDYEDIFNYRPPRFTLPEQFPPPYSIMDADFPYSYGLTFVNYLFARGNWAEVNKAYENPPQSTEQILHPAKYISGEGPKTVNHPDIGAALGEAWRPIGSDTLGEWGTYLMLGYGADVAAQLEDRKAESAARGWGGDRYHIFHSDEAEATFLAARWVWDTQADSTEFFQTMHNYLDERFRGAQVDGASGACWEVNEQYSCVYQDGIETLWLIAPDSGTLQTVVGLYPNYP
jgi:hypothetical protein